MKTNKRKFIAPIAVTVIMVAYYAAYFGLLFWLLRGVWKYLLAILPLGLSVVMIKVCIERIYEIQEGEENDLSKY